MIGFNILASLSTLTVIVKIGLTGILTIIVTVINEFDGIIGNPEILTPFVL